MLGSTAPTGENCEWWQPNPVDEVLLASIRKLPGLQWLGARFPALEDLFIQVNPIYAADIR
jgi:hypothetical protein